MTELSRRLHTAAIAVSSDEDDRRTKTLSPPPERLGAVIEAEDRPLYYRPPETSARRSGGSGKAWLAGSAVVALALLGAGYVRLAGLPGLSAATPPVAAPATNNPAPTAMSPQAATAPAASPAPSAAADTGLAQAAKPIQAPPPTVAKPAPAAAAAPAVPELAPAKDVATAPPPAAVPQQEVAPEVRKSNGFLAPPPGQAAAAPSPAPAPAVQTAAAAAPAPPAPRPNAAPAHETPRPASPAPLHKAQAPADAPAKPLPLPRPVIRPASAPASAPATATPDQNEPTVTIDGLTYIDGRQPRPLGTLSVPADGNVDPGSAPSVSPRAGGGSLQAAQSAASPSQATGAPTTLYAPPAASDNAAMPLPKDVIVLPNGQMALPSGNGP